MGGLVNSGGDCNTGCGAIAKFAIVELLCCISIIRRSSFISSAILLFCSNTSLISSFCVEDMMLWMMIGSN